MMMRKYRSSLPASLAAYHSLSVTTRPYDARRDAPLSRRQTRHNERSSETEGSALSLLFYYFSNLEPARLGISTSAKALSCFPHYRKPQYRNDITSRLSLSLDIAPFPLSLRLFLNSEVTPHFPTVDNSLLHRRDTVPPVD